MADKKLIVWLCALVSLQMVAGVSRQLLGNVVRRSVSTLVRNMEQHQIVPDVVDTAPTKVAKVCIILYVYTRGYSI